MVHLTVHAPLLVALPLLGLVVAPTEAFADADEAKAACLSAHEDGQFLRNSGQLRAARERLVECDRPACPPLGERDCANLIVELEAEQPTLIVEARNAHGDETLGGRVFVDGVLVSERRDAVAVPVDPGQHVLRVELPDVPAVEQTVVVRPGEKDRRIVLQLPEAPFERSPVPPASRPVPGLALVLGGTTLVAAGSFAYFAVAGKNLENDRARTCLPRCTDAQLAAVRIDYALADVSLAIAVLSAGAALWVILAPHGPRVPNRVAWGAVAGPAGAMASLRVGF